VNTIIGSYVSPFVRKALVCLELNGLAYDIDPITPYPDRYSLLPVDVANRARALARGVRRHQDRGRARVGRVPASGARSRHLGQAARPRSHRPGDAGGISAAVDRVLAQPVFTKLQPFEDRQVRTPIAQQRAVLAAMGAPLTPETVGGETPRSGSMHS
jgi:hypothetical protein